MQVFNQQPQRYSLLSQMQQVLSLKKGPDGKPQVQQPQQNQGGFSQFAA